MIDPSRATSFDAVVATYEAARPGYPSALYERLERIGLVAGARVLEIGPGPGPVTAELLERGASVVAVEAGPAMADRLSERFASAACEVVRGTFEEAELTGPFDLAVAATSLHWVDLEVGLPKLAALLPPGAWLAVWWNVHGPLRVEEDPCEARLRDIILRYLPPDEHEVPYARDIAARCADLAAGGWFEVLEHQRFRWPWHHDAASLRALFASFSNFSTLPEPQRTGVLDDIATMVEEELGGSVVRTYTTELYLARRVAS